MVAGEDSTQRVLRVEPDKMDALAGQIGSATSEFGEGLRSVDDAVRSLLGTGWRGDPGSQFHDAFIEWHKGAGDVVTGMSQMVEILHSAASDFREA